MSNDDGVTQCSIYALIVMWGHWVIVNHRESKWKTYQGNGLDPISYMLTKQNWIL